ncbi:hypothetical protein IBX65_01320 [Candidatus Aerophobetes bacterium]|nr:hypothetical protein [Candidatus Aerophobetes bacterium]
MNRQELLNQAEEHIFSTGLTDSGSKLCKSNMRYGLAKIHYWQQKMGLYPLAVFIGSPDMTITRNRGRWMSGFGYGGKISWGKGEEEVIVLDTKPNACGMLVGGMYKLPDEHDLLKKIEHFQTHVNIIDDVEVEWDFSKGNHFIDIFSAKPRRDVNLPPYLFIIHGSANELKEKSPCKWGLYWDESASLKEAATKFDTPFGMLYLAEGKNAQRFFKLYQFAHNFSKKKRELVAKHLFCDYELIFNENHQGLLNYNEILLGCHFIDDFHNKLYPLTLRSDLPAYLLRGKPNLSCEVIDALGFENRSKKLGVYDYLEKANIIPHGGGYVFPHLLNVEEVYEVGEKRYFKTDVANDRGKQIISNTRDIPYQFRGREVLLKVMELDMAEIVAKLIPLYVVKV